MPTEHRRVSRWVRGLALGGIGLLGLVTLVGSGGGALGLPSDCPPGLDCSPRPPPPSLSVEPPSVTAQVGTPVTFVAVTANASGTFSYQWRRSPDGGTTFVDIPGATASSYALASVSLADDGAVFKALAWQGDGATLQATSRLAVSATPGIVFADGDFAVDNWQASPAIFAGNPQFTHVEERIDSDGNPGAFRKMTDQVAPGSGLSNVTHLSLSSIYDPRVQGAIAVIDYAEDCIVFSASDINYAESGIFVEQDGRSYVSNASQVLCTLSKWTGAARYSLGQQDFRQFDGPACNADESCPDFSATGATMRFGYARTAFTTPGGSVVHGIDNWKVTVWRR
jgi:hypothetical protein